MNRVDELIQTFAEMHYSARQIRSVLVHEGVPSNEWGLLCKLAMWVARPYLNSPKYATQVAFVFVNYDGFPAEADGGGIWYWAAGEVTRMVTRRAPDASATVVAELLRDCGFDYKTSVGSLGDFYRSSTSCRMLKFDDQRMIVIDFGERGVEIVRWKV